MACGRADASVRGAAEARAGDAVIDDTGAAGALRGAGLAAITGEAPPFCSIMRIASSGVGMSAT